MGQTNKQIENNKYKWNDLGQVHGYCVCLRAFFLAVDGCVWMCGMMASQTYVSRHICDAQRKFLNAFDHNGKTKSLNLTSHDSTTLNFVHCLLPLTRNKINSRKKPKEQKPRNHFD